LFQSRTKSVTQNISRRFIERLLRVAQRVPGNRMQKFGTASIFSTVFSMHSIGFLLRETEPE